MKRAVVTGGLGFVGSHVVDLLVADGVEVFIIDNLSTGKISNVENGIGRARSPEWMEGDIRDDGARDGILNWEPDVIFHLAAQTDVPSSVRDPEDDADVNILGTLNILAAAKQVGAKVVYASSGGAIYGNRASGPARETDPVSPESPYAVSKLAAEGYVRIASHHNCVLRYSNVYGPRQLATAEGGVVAIFAGALRQEHPPIVYGDGGQTRDFVHVSDVARATIAAADWEGVLNVGTGRETTILELLRAMVKIGGYGDVAVIEQPAREGDIRFSSVDPSRLADSFIWIPVGLEDGLAMLAEVPA